LSASILFIFLTYYSMVCRSKGAATLLVVITIPDCSDHVKSAITSDLIFLSALLILVMYALMNNSLFIFLRRKVLKNQILISFVVIALSPLFLNNLVSQLNTAN